MFGIGLSLFSIPAFILATSLAQPEIFGGDNALSDVRRWAQVIVALAATWSSVASVVLEMRALRAASPRGRGPQLVALATMLWLVWVALAFDWIGDE